LPEHQNSVENANAAPTPENSLVSEVEPEPSIEKKRNSKSRTPTNGSDITSKSVKEDDENSETSKTAKKKIKDKKPKTKPLISPQEILRTGQIKIRNPLKKWNMRYAVLIEGKLIYYTSQADAEREVCRGIILLNNCYIKERHTKKDGFCIKIFNTLNHPIFSRQDLRGKPLNKPLAVNMNYCLLRLKSTEEGKDWLRHLIKATPDFDHTKSLVEKDNDSDSSDGPDDADESESSQGDNETPTTPAVSATVPLLQLNPPSSINLPGTESAVVNNTRASPGTQSPTRRREDSKNEKLPPPKILKKQTQSETKFNPPSQRKSLDGSNPNFITTVDQPIKPQPGVITADYKEMMVQLQNTLRDDFNKVIDAKLDQYYKNVISTKLDNSESRISYLIRSGLPETRTTSSSSKNNHSQKSSKSETKVKKFLELARTQVTLNTLLLLVIIYFLLSILWTINDFENLSQQATNK